MSNKHKHYDMIVAKAKNMDLVVFQTDDDLKEWNVLDRFPMWGESTNYFLCLPKHKDACLHWLNGGDVEVSADRERWEEYNFSVEHPKYPMTDFTGYEFQFRIKPKKENRWIAYSTNQKRLGCLSFDSEQEARAYYIHEVEEPQFIEIEVEV